MTTLAHECDQITFTVQVSLINGFIQNSRAHTFKLMCNYSTQVKVFLLGLFGILFVMLFVCILHLNCFYFF